MRNLKTSRDFSRKRGIGMNTHELKHMARVAEWKEKVPALPEQRIPEGGGTALAAKVRMGNVEVEIYGGVRGETIELVLRALKDAE